MGVCTSYTQPANCAPSLYDRGEFQTQSVRLLCSILATLNALAALGQMEIIPMWDETEPDTFVPFLRQIGINTAGVKVVLDFELDGTTSYTVVGTVTTDPGV